MKEKLHPFHLSILIYMIQSGVVIFSLPRLLAQYSGYNGWISIFLFYILVTINIVLISLVYRYSDGKSIFEIIEQALPKLIYVPLYIFLFAVWTLTGCMVAKQYIIIYQVFVFPTTHPMLLKLIVDVLAYLLIVKGIYNISKAATIFFVFVIWTIFLLLYFIADFQWVNLTTFYFSEAPSQISGLLKILAAFLGYELVLLIFPYAEKKKTVMKAVHIGNLLTTLTYLLVSFVCFGFYSFDQLKRLKYPLIDLLAHIELPFVERIENLIFSLFLFSSLISHVLYNWAAIQTTQRVLPKTNMKWITIFVLLVVYGISWIPDVLAEVELWLHYLGLLAIGIAFGLPTFLILILLLTKRRI